jgi:hypothetical protein
VLTAIDKTIRYRSLVTLEGRTAKVLYSALDKILRLYNGAGYTIKEIRCDREFRPLMDPVNDELDVDMVYWIARDHVPEAERNNRTIKEQIRATINSLPFKA